MHLSQNPTIRNYAWVALNLQDCCRKGRTRFQSVRYRHIWVEQEQHMDMLGNWVKEKRGRSYEMLLTFMALRRFNKHIKLGVMPKGRLVGR